MRLWGGMVIAVAIAGCGARVREPAPVAPPVAAGHVVVQGAPHVGQYRVPELFWQMTPSMNRIVRSLGTEIIIQDPATGAIIERIATEGVPAYFGLTTDGAVLCVAMWFSVPTAARTGLEVSPTQRLAAWSLDEHRWLWQHDGAANGILLGRERCGFVRATGAESQRRRAFELVVFDARRGTQLGDARTIPGSTTSRTTQHVSANGRWALSPATTQVGFSDGQAPAWTLYRTDDLSVALQWNGPCARFEPDGKLAVDGTTRTARAHSLEMLGLELATCSPAPTKIGTPPAAVFTPAPDGSGLLAMHREATGIALVLHEPSGARRLALTETPRVARAVATTDGARVFVVEDAALRAWTLAGGAAPDELATGVSAGPFLDRSGRTLGWIAEGALQRRDLATNHQLEPLRLPDEPAARWQVALGSDGSAAALASGRRDVLFVIDSGRWRAIHTDASGRVRAIALAGSPANAIAGLDERRGLRVWSLDGRERAPRPLGPQRWRGLAVSEDGATLATTHATEAGTQVELAGLDLAVRRAYVSPLFAHSIAALRLVGDGAIVAGAPAADGCVEERCFLDDGRSLVALDGRGSVAFASDALLVQHAAERDGIRLVTIAGATRLTFGSRGSGWFAYTPNGRYACDGDGCAVFRCNVGGVLVDMNRCAALRAAGLANLHD